MVGENSCTAVREPALELGIDKMQAEISVIKKRVRRKLRTRVVPPDLGPFFRDRGFLFFAA